MIGTWVSKLLLEDYTTTGECAAGKYRFFQVTLRADSINANRALFPVAVASCNTRSVRQGRRSLESL